LILGEVTYEARSNDYRLLRRLEGLRKGSARRSANERAWRTGFVDAILQVGAGDARQAFDCEVCQTAEALKEERYVSQKDRQENREKGTCQEGGQEGCERWTRQAGNSTVEAPAKEAR